MLRNVHVIGEGRRRGEHIRSLEGVTLGHPFGESALVPAPMATASFPREERS